MKKILLAVLMLLAFSGTLHAAVTVTNLAELSDAVLSADVTDIAISGTINLSAASNDFQIARDINFTGSGTGKLMVSHATGKMLTINTGKVTFTGITLEATSGAGTMVTASTGTVDFKGVTFIGAAEAVEVDGATVTFDSSCKFDAMTTRAVNVTGGSATFTGTTFSIPSSTGTEIIAASSAGSLTFTNAIFSGNVVRAIAISGSASGTFSGTNFTDNTNTTDVVSVAESGSVAFSSGKFSGNAGQAVTLSGSASGTFNGTNFTGNKNANGVVSAAGNGSVTFTSGEFSDNAGRAVALSGSVTGTFDGTSFTGNAGAISAVESSILALGANMTFSGNDAGTANGGALNITTSGNVTFNASAYAFADNSAANGGAIYTTKPIAAADFEKMSFSDNSATASGGAIYTTQNIEITSNKFEGNTADDGGAIYIQRAAGRVTIKGGTFEGNIASNSGGVVAGSPQPIVDVSGGTFKANSATVGDGGVINGGTVTVSGGTFGGVSGEENTAGQFGGVVFAASSATITGGTFTGNDANTSGGVLYSAGSVSVTGGKFVSNTASSPGALGVNGGGAIYAANGLSIAPATAGSVSFESNKSPGDGGAVLVTGGNATVSDTIFKSNEADNGGAIFSSTSNPLTVTNSLFDNNKSAVSGGAIQTGDTTSLTRCSFVNNVATGYGGAVFLPTTARTYSVLQCLFRNNGAQGGGAIYLSGDAQTVSVVRSYFENNSANGDGGAIDVSGARLNLSQSTFTRNEAKNGGNGGAVSVGAFSYGILNSTFVANTAATGQGGGVYFASDAGTNTTTVQAIMYYCTFADNQAVLGGGMSAGMSSNLVIEACVLTGNTAVFGGAGGDTYRDQTTITSRGYNVINNHGANSGSGPVGNVNWKADSGVRNATNDAYNSTYTRSLLFGSNVLASNSGSGVTTYVAGSTLQTGMTNEITTLALAPNSSTSTTLNPALGILDGTTAAREFVNYFSGSAAGVRYDHTDARGVWRAVSSPAPAGGVNCDAGAYQTIDSSGPTPPGGPTISHVKMGGLPNFTLREGQTCSLTASVYVFNTSTGGTTRDASEAVRWRSSDTAVAQIDQYGNLVLVGRGQAYITVTTERNSYTGSPATDRIEVNVNLSPSYTNIAYSVWTDLGAFNSTLATRGIQMYLADTDPDLVDSSSFASSFRQKYGVEPTQITEIDSSNGLRFRSSANYRGALSAFKPSTGLTMATYEEDGGVLSMKYVYNIEWSDVSSILGKEVTSVTQNDVLALFNSFQLVFTDENGVNHVVVDRSGSQGVSVSSAMSSGALKVGGVNTSEFDSVGSLVMHLHVLIGDAEATDGGSASLIGDKIVVSDNDGNGRIDGEMWLLYEKSSGSGGGDGDGGGGGGCSTGLPILAIVLATFAFRMRRRG